MAGKVQELRSLYSDNSDDVAKEIGELWDKFNNLREPWMQECIDVQNYLFATDTSTTEVDELGWKNKTTLPKLCQIRDNLHANYYSALFPNDNWVRWESDNSTDAAKEKRKIIEGYISTKVRQSNFKDTESELLFDYIDYGMAFSADVYEREVTINPKTGEEIRGYTGPKEVRIDPKDIVFNPAAPTFRSSPKIIRKILGIGEVMKLATDDEDWYRAMEKSATLRSRSGNYTRTDWNKAVRFAIDGFGDLREYYGSAWVEVLTFEGDSYNEETGILDEDYQIVVIDRSITVKKQKIPHPLGKGRIDMVGWRKRPGNLYAMGPLVNLVGMQYRIDHLQNLKADALDLMVHPPLVIKGDVDPFTWHPNSQIHISEDGDIKELGLNLTGVSAANMEIELLENKMEEFAGAPKEAMGIRTPGEKTAFEVQSLQSAAGRIFQEKIINYEVNHIEPRLNSMLATAIEEGDIEEEIKVFNDELGMKVFREVTTSDLKASGTLYPIGARHFGEQAQLVQNLVGIANSAIWVKIEPHVSAKNLAKLVDDILQLDKYGIIRPEIGITEAQEGRDYAATLEDESLNEQGVETEPQMDILP